MSDDETPAAFTLDYQISADDYAELVEVERSASRWRPISNALTAVILISACAGTFLTVRDFSKLGSCVNAEPAPSYAPVRVWIWQCSTAATPSGVVGDEAVLSAADTLLWYIGISGALGSRRRRPQRQARRLMRRPGVAGGGTCPRRPPGSYPPPERAPRWLVPYLNWPQRLIDRTTAVPPFYMDAGLMTITALNTQI